MNVINVRRLGHATLTTPDIDRQIAYYTEVVGLALVERSKDNESDEPDRRTETHHSQARHTRRWQGLLLF